MSAWSRYIRGVIGQFLSFAKKSFAQAERLAKLAAKFLIAIVAVPVGLMGVVFALLSKIYKWLTLLAYECAKQSRIVYDLRAKITGNLLLVLLLACLTVAVDYLLDKIGLKYELTSSWNAWLLVEYHWLWFVGVAFALVVLTWNYLSPTLRSLVGTKKRIGLVLLFAFLMRISAEISMLENAAHRYVYIYLLAGLIGSLGLVAIVWESKKVEPKAQIIEEDEPKNRSSWYDYQSHEQPIADIRNMLERGRPSAFAITGAWGIGKTSVICRVTDDPTAKIIRMNFEPWRYTSEEALVRGFYREMTNIVSSTIPGIQGVTHAAMVASEQLVKKHDGSGIIGAIIDAWRDIQETNAKYPEQIINNLLQQEHYRLVIVIDDVDRLHDTAILLRALQLAQITRPFECIQVVYLFNRSVIEAALPGHFTKSDQDRKSYLEKFVAREVFIAKPRQQELLNHFFELVEMNRELLQSDLSDQDIPNEVKAGIDTPRSVIRLFNEYAAFIQNNRGTTNE